MKQKYFVFVGMLVLAIFALGSVSAAENVTTDIDVQTEDIALDDVSVEEDVEQDNELDELQSVTPQQVNNNTNIQNIIDGSTDSIILNFTEGNYNNFALDLSGHSNIELWGNGATLNGAASQDIFTVTNTNNIVIKDFIINVGSNAAAIYGHHVTHSVFTNNTITGGKDGINIFQIHENLTITNNNISGFTRDGISLVNFNTYSDSEWNSFVASEISGNKITGGQYGMFFGGNFKGVISDNKINGSGVGVEFAGKRTPTNGRLYADFDNNTIVNVSTGINMLHPTIEYFNITYCNVSASNYAIYAEDPFGTSVDYIGIYYSTFVGDISGIFEDEVGTNYGNNTGFPS